MATAPAAARTLRLSRPLDLHGTLRAVQRGGGDPTMQVRPDGVWRGTRTPAGPGTERLQAGRDGTLRVEAWGPGADWLVARAPVLVGEPDDDSGFAPEQPLLRELRRRHPGLRIPRTEAVFEAASASILEQRVQGHAAWLSWRRLVRELGEPAPGPLVGLFVPPDPQRLARTPYWVLHGHGVERLRADTVRRAARSARRLEETITMPPADARLRLRTVPGIGHWTAAEVALVALGDADAVSVGDYHLPHVVSWALAGEAQGTDERMLELLEPYRGHRARVLRLLTVAGIGPPRRGPRLPLRDVAAM
ncbi:MAG TPA: DNA-3-methyladenine glycosylase 2 family protein [Candidatus Dormibacteraeota bacterium]|nr:DNA-3-methyladenine glycosylase 2 family protein [Candidatus Dormibacteraeota bacterium]